MACNFCKADLYIKAVQYTKPSLAPLTRAEELRQELLDLTGEVYLQVPNEYCAMCGEKITAYRRKRGETLDNIQKCEFMEDKIYPLTIVRDRYTGVYSGGEYTAWNLDFYEIPMDIALSDVCCMEFWDNEENQKKYVVGKGRTASEALADLYIKLKGGTNG